MKNIPKICKNCQSDQLSWFCQPNTTSGVVDGRLKMSEIDVIFFLGCGECSETLKIVKGDDVAEYLNNNLQIC